MEVGYISQQDQIRIQTARIENQNYVINWLASVYHQDLLVCLKSSWIAFDEFKNILLNHCIEPVYQNEKVYWQKVTRQTSLQISTSTIRQPVDVILLPITRDKLLIPADDKACDTLQKTIKGIIKYTQKREAFFFSFSAIEHISFYNIFLPLERDEIIAEYYVDSMRYPVTVAMLNKNISIQIPKKSTCQLRFTDKMKNKYNLIKSEE